MRMIGFEKQNQNEVTKPSNAYCGLIANFIREFYHRQEGREPSSPIIYRFSKEKRGNFSKRSGNFSK